MSKKMLKNTLKSVLPDIEERLTALDLNLQTRPEELSLQNFLGLVNDGV